jgi:5-methylcytosine-specific restriction protein A
MALKPQTRSTEGAKETRRQYDQRRGTPEERGYDWQWRQFSKRIREERPICEWCLERGMVRPSEEVHHLKKLRDFPELKYDPENVAAICTECHSAATARGE